MRITSSPALLLAAILATACGPTPVDGLLPQTALFVSGPVANGGVANGVFRNSTGVDLSVGDLGCVVNLQKSDHGGWQDVPSARVCRAVARIVPAGDSLTFTFASPATSGIYRIQTTGTLVQPPSDGGQTELILATTVLSSAPFVTTP